MARSSKTASKKTQTKKDANLAEARPVGEGKDPLAEGNTLVNPSNTEGETHYEVKERSDDVREADNKIDGQDANQRAEQHNAQSRQANDTPNSDADEQDAVAEGRTEDGEEPEAPAEDSDPLAERANKEAP